MMNPDFDDLLAEFNAQRVDCSRHHLIANKKASGRLQDLEDMERLGAE